MCILQIKSLISKMIKTKLITKLVYSWSTIKYDKYSNFYFPSLSL